jgi:hypothetical protein
MTPLLVWLAVATSALLIVVYFVLARVAKPEKPWEVTTLIINLLTGIIPVPVLYLFTVLFMRTLGVHQEPVDGTRQACYEHAYATGKKYLIESAVMQVSLLGDSPTRRRASIRMVYSVKALKPISAEATLFEERYTPQGANCKGTPLQGNIEREPAPNPFTNYAIRFASQPGEVKVITTGVEQEYDLPLKRRCVGDGTIPLGAGEDYFGYANSDKDDDAICELAVIIESSNPALVPSEPALAEYHRQEGIAFTLKRLKSMKLTEEDALKLTNRTSLEESGAAPRVGGPISFRWKNVFGGQRVGLVFKTTPAAAELPAPAAASAATVPPPNL